MNTSIKRYPAKEHHQPVERICRTLELRDDPQLIAEYRRRHSQGAIWPEIPVGIREAGILEMEIYLLDTRLFMIVEVPVGFDWDAAMERHILPWHSPQLFLSAAFHIKQEYCWDWDCMLSVHSCSIPPC